jgi:uncharacterized protein (TIGR00369 family)
MDRINDSFARQGLMRSLGAKIIAMSPGHCRLSAPVTPEVCQQHGAGHAGLSFALGDTAAGYAALTLLDEGREVMTSEMKIHLLRPAFGVRLEARGTVVKAGRRLVVAQAEVFAFDENGTETQVALLLGTMVPVDPA